MTQTSVQKKKSLLFLDNCFYTDVTCDQNIKIDAMLLVYTKQFAYKLLLHDQELSNQTWHTSWAPERYHLYQTLWHQYAF